MTFYSNSTQKKENEIKHDEAVGISYMKSWEREMMIQGGRQGTRQRGRRTKGIHLIQLLIKKSLTDEIERAVTDNTCQQELFEEFKL